MESSNFNEKFYKKLTVIEKKVNLILAEVSSFTSKESSSPSDITQKDILTFYEAAEFLGVSKSLLYKLTSQMLLPHYKPRGKMVYFDKKELEDWIREGRIESIISTFNTK